MLVIRPRWGIQLFDTYDEAMARDLRSLAYEWDMIVFKNLGALSPLQYFHLMEKFGRPWTAQEYRDSGEHPFEFDGGVLSTFSNETAKRLGTREMPWHVDIPNSGAASFPWRALYNVKNPNPEGGLTTWMNIRLDNIQPAPEELELYQRLKVLNQSWLRLKGAEFNLHDFIKTHPVTGVQSLRSNYFVAPGWAETAWIKETYLDGEKVDNLATLGPIYKRLSEREDLVYTHKWNVHDLIVYDNHSFMHRRTALDLQAGEVREFIRANAHHVV